MNAVPIAVLISGSGTNMEAIADHLEHREDIAVAVVISDRPGAAGLIRALERGLTTSVVDWNEYSDREAFTRALCDAVEAAGCRYMVLAGFMRILAPEAIQRFPARIVNVHPSLLPEFPGAHAVEDALRAGCHQTGVTVHIVDELVDHGPFLAQEPVDVLPGDTVESLHARIQRVEHRLYPRVVAQFVTGGIDVVDPGER